MSNILTHISVKDEVTATVRTPIFYRSYAMKPHTFTISRIDNGVITGISIVDGSEATFQQTQITAINGMDVSRWKVSLNKKSD